MSKLRPEYLKIVDLDPTSHLAGYYHTLRAQVDFAAARVGARALSISSGWQGEGRSATAINLALAYARAGKKVLLIDSDLRKPSLHDILQVSRRDGLSEYLSRSIPTTQIIKETDYPNMQIITSGSLPPNPTELLSSERFDQLIALAKEHYDRVVVDMSPLFASADAQIVVSNTDGVLLIAEHARTTRNQLQRAVGLIEQIGKPVIGTVINKA
ncbi:CpsD/CapB family tyrosine-protein kinase [Cohnella sp. GCM10020058]|uniref:CpsD/CapB family tyrosine-protein kinase n=1 Tax=Cohnella sp. GCM10020058 TaxID=3317330 RepID=UPI003625DC0E